MKLQISGLMSLVVSLFGLCLFCPGALRAELWESDVDKIVAKHCDPIRSELEELKIQVTLLTQMVQKLVESNPAMKHEQAAALEAQIGIKRVRLMNLYEGIAVRYPQIKSDGQAVADLALQKSRIETLFQNVAGAPLEAFNKAKDETSKYRSWAKNIGEIPVEGFSEKVWDAFQKYPKTRTEVAKEFGKPGNPAQLKIVLQKIREKFASAEAYEKELAAKSDTALAKEVEEYLKIYGELSLLLKQKANLDAELHALEKGTPLLENGESSQK